MPADVRDLLAAVVAALDLPQADTADHQARAIVLDRRASDAQIILTSVLRGDNVTDCTEQLRRWTAECPAAYRVWAPAPPEDGAEVAAAGGEAS